MYGSALAVVTIILILLAYILCCTSDSFLYQWAVTILKVLLFWSQWALFTPFMESFLSVFNCEDGQHKVIDVMKCYEGVHIFLIILSILFAILLLGIAIFCSLLLNETQPYSTDALSKSEDISDVICVFYRTVLVILSVFLTQVIFLLILDYWCLGVYNSILIDQPCSYLLLFCLYSVL